MLQEGHWKIYHSIKTGKYLAEIVRIKMFTILEVNQRFAATQGAFIQEKLLNIDKNSELCGILAFLSLIAFSVAHW